MHGITENAKMHIMGLSEGQKEVEDKYSNI